MVRPLLDYPSRRRLDRCINISDLRDAAKLRAHKMVFDYLDAGADDEITIRRNKDAYSQLELHYRILAGLSPPLDMSTRVMGRDVKIPFFVSPTAGSKMFHADGEVGVARAASAAGAMYSLSTMGTAAPAEVAPAVPAHHPKLFQLYVWKDRSLARDMLAQARENGFHALALTVDLTWYGNRERDHRNGFTVPPAYTARWAKEAYLLNCLNAMAAALGDFPGASAARDSLNSRVASLADTIADDEAGRILRSSGVAEVRELIALYQGQRTERGAMSRDPALELGVVGSALDKLVDEVSASPEPVPAFDEVLNPRTRVDLRGTYVGKIIEAYTLVYMAVLDPNNGYRDAKSAIRHGPDALGVLLN